LHVSDDRITDWGAIRLMVAAFDTPFRVAVKLAV
jgi:hypothetical protein